jgi:hypothetical protein
VCCLLNQGHSEGRRAFLFESSIELGIEKRDSSEIFKDRFLLLISALSSAGLKISVIA